MSYIIYLSYTSAYNACSTYNVDDSEYGKVALFLFFFTQRQASIIDI